MNIPSSMSIYCFCFLVLIQTSTLSAKVVHEDDNFLKIGTSNVIRKIKFKSERGGLEGISINNNVRLKAVSGLGNGNFVTYSKPITSIWRNLKNKCGFGYSIIIPVLVPSVATTPTTTTTAGTPDARS